MKPRIKRKKMIVKNKKNEIREKIKKPVKKSLKKKISIANYPSGNIKDKTAKEAIHEPEKIAVLKKKEFKLNITEAKIMKMLDFSHLEDLFHLLSLLDEKQASLFLEHYKNQENAQNNDAKLDKLVRSSSSKSEL